MSYYPGMSFNPTATGPNPYGGGYYNYGQGQPMGGYTGYSYPTQNTYQTPYQAVYPTQNTGWVQPPYGGGYGASPYGGGMDMYAPMQPPPAPPEQPVGPPPAQGPSMEELQKMFGPQPGSDAKPAAGKPGMGKKLIIGALAALAAVFGLKKLFGGKGEELPPEDEAAEDPGTEASQQAKKDEKSSEPAE